VPTLPNSKLGPNSRHHHYARNALMQSAKDGMVAELVAQGCRQSPLWESAHLELVFQAGDKRRRDLDNLIACCKPWIDALVGEVIVDDSADRLSLSATYKRGDIEETILMVTCTSPD
jgi:Holliday junction resolvase RusA-like endonuclease